MTRTLDGSVVRRVRHNVHCRAVLQSVEELLPETLKKEATSRPRVVRVNTCLMSVAEAKAWLAVPPEEHSAFAVKVNPILKPFLPQSRSTLQQEHSAVEKAFLHHTYSVIACFATP